MQEVDMLTTLPYLINWGDVLGFRTRCLVSLYNGFAKSLTFCHIYPHKEYVLSDNLKLLQTNKPVWQGNRTIDCLTDKSLIDWDGQGRKTLKVAFCQKPRKNKVSSSKLPMERVIFETNGQTWRQTDRRTNVHTPAGMQASKQASKQTNKQNNKQNNKQTK